MKASPFLLVAPILPLVCYVNTAPIRSLVPNVKAGLDSALSIVGSLGDKFTVHQDSGSDDDIVGRYDPRIWGSLPDDELLLDGDVDPITGLIDEKTWVPKKGERFVILGDDLEPMRITESQKLILKRRKINFFDITDNYEWFMSLHDVKVPIYNYPDVVSYSKQVNDLIGQINKTNLHDNLSYFSSFYTRYYKSDMGVQSADWLYEQVSDLASSNPDLGVTVTKFRHNWLQYSVIVHIPGTETPEDLVIVGAHQDSTNLLFPSFLGAPGADDDGSGVTTNLEALRIFIQNNIKPKNSVEFHFFSAEEAGLLGSQDIFASYKKEGKKVVSMLQQDMTGYVQKTLDNNQPEHVGVITDYVSEYFTSFIKLIIDNYLSIPWVETKCGYACSDHASALKHGYPSSFIIESEFKYTNPYIHSTSDTIDKLSIDHIAEFTKLVLGYVVELGFHKFEEIK